MKAFIAGLIAGVVLVCLAGYVFIVSGGMPVPTKSPPLPFEEKIASLSIEAAMKGSGDIKPAFEVSEERLLRGADVYLKNCSGCHGLPGQAEPSAPAKGMFPAPPQLFQPDHGVTDDPLGSTYWVVKNGIRLTGMPGFESTFIEEELWDVSWLLQKANDLPASVKERLSRVKSKEPQ